MIRKLLALLFPPKCILCGELLKKEEQDLCHWCLCNTREYNARKNSPQFLDSVAAVWYYEGKVRQTLLRYKFRRGRFLGEPLGRVLASRVRGLYPEGFDLLTWVPVSPMRKWTRGYDQAELIARSAGKVLGMEPVPLLKKVRNNRPQSGIRGLPQRRANVLGVYRMAGAPDLSGKRILLLDDILTTGATAGECARVLLTAGAEEVHCAVIAAAGKNTK